MTVFSAAATRRLTSQSPPDAAGPNGKQERNMTINIRGTFYEENLNNKMGLEFYDLSHPWGLGQPS